MTDTERLDFLDALPFNDLESARCFPDDRHRLWIDLKDGSIIALATGATLRELIDGAVEATKRTHTPHP